MVRLGLFFVLIKIKVVLSLRAVSLIFDRCLDFAVVPFNANVHFEVSAKVVVLRKTVSFVALLHLLVVFTQELIDGKPLAPLTWVRAFVGVLALSLQN